MLDSILKNALSGVTVIEEETGSVSRILAKQMAGYATSAGNRVAFLSFGAEERPIIERNVGGVQGASGRSEVEESVVGDADVVTQMYGSGQRYSFLEGLNHDLIIIDSFSTYLYDKSEKEAQELIKQVARIARQEKKSFIITYDKGLLPKRTTAFLEATADSVIIIRVEITVDRVTRMLYIPKMRDSRPLDRLIKITIDEVGVQVDTREYVG